MQWWEEIQNSGILPVATSLGLNIRKNMLSPCPKCNAEKRGSTDKRYPIGLNTSSNGWKCHKCDTTGSTIDLISFKLNGKRYRELHSEQRKSVYKWAVNNKHAVRNHRQAYKKIIKPIPKKNTPKIPTDPNSPFRWNEKLPQLYKQRLHKDEGLKVLEFLAYRKLDLDVIKTADLGAMNDPKTGNWLVIPLKNKEGKIVNMRFRSIPPLKKTFRSCPNQPLPLYGCETLTTERENQDLIITEGELDVLAMRSIGYIDNVVSGTAGAQANWKDDWLDSIEPFQSFSIFYDNDKAGNEGAEKLAKKLGLYRCARTKLKTKDVGELLENNAASQSYQQIKELVQIAIDKSTPFIETNLKTAADYLDEIEQLIENPQDLKGLTTYSKRVDACCGGIKNGLWVITGDTGHGKTTWATFQCWKQASNGTPVMLTSFEQSPVGTAQKLLRSQLGQDFTKCSKEQRREAMNLLGAMPLYILDHYGNAKLQQIIEATRFAARRYNVKIALIDHLGFLINTDPATDERREIEKAVRELATIAINDKLTIFLICHPNNLANLQQRRVKISDLKGASAIRQDAHVALVVERQEVTSERQYPATTLWFDKVRSEFGSNGSHCTIAFDPLACVYADEWKDTPAAKRGVSIIAPNQTNKKNKSNNTKCRK